MRIILGVLVVVLAMFAQEPKPTCNHCSASYIPKSEIDAYIQRAIAGHIIDQQVRSVDLGRSQVGVGLVRRERLTSPETSEVAEGDAGAIGALIVTRPSEPAFNLSISPGALPKS